MEPQSSGKTQRYPPAISPYITNCISCTQAQPLAYTQPPWKGPIGFHQGHIRFSNIRPCSIVAKPSVQVGQLFQYFSTYRMCPVPLKACRNLHLFAGNQRRCFKRKKPLCLAVLIVAIKRTKKRCDTFKKCILVCDFALHNVAACGFESTLPRHTRLSSRQ